MLVILDVVKACRTQVFIKASLFLHNGIAYKEHGLPALQNGGGI